MSKTNSKVMTNSDNQALFDKKLAYLTNQVRNLHINLLITKYFKKPSNNFNYRLYNEQCISKLIKLFNSKFGKLLTTKYIYPISTEDKHQILVRKYFLSLDSLNYRLHNPFYAHDKILSLMDLYYHFHTLDAKLRGSLYSLNIHNHTQCQFVKQGVYREYIDFEKIVVSYMSRLLLKNAHHDPSALPFDSLPKGVRIDNKNDKKSFNLNFATVDTLRRHYADVILHYAKYYLRPDLLVSTDSTLQGMINEIKHYKSVQNHHKPTCEPKQKFNVMLNHFKQLFGLHSNNHFLIIFKDVPSLTNYLSEPYAPHTLHGLLVVLEEFQHECSLSELSDSNEPSTKNHSNKSIKNLSNSEKILKLAKKLVDIEQKQINLDKIRNTIIKKFNDLDD